jgi:nitrate reductase NapE component
MKTKTISKTENKNIIDVVNDFDCSTQREEYNKKFKEWRRRKDNPYAFNFRENKKETVFNDSRGFEKRSQVQEEKYAIRKIMYVIGVAMIMYMAFEHIFGKLIAEVLHLAGASISVSMISNTLYGNTTEVVSLLMLVSVLKYAIPAVYIQCKLKTPSRVGFMLRVNNSAEIINSIGLTLIACTLVCLPVAYSSDTTEIFEYFRSAESDEVDLWGQKEFVIYTVFTIVIFPILSEILIHGPVFAALRQFGDPFAIVVTTAFACLITKSATEVPAALIISVLSAAAMLRSGTIFTAIVVNIIYRMYYFTLIIFETSDSANMLLRRNLFMLIALVTGAFISGGIYLYRKLRKTRKPYIAHYNSEITFAKRLTIAAKTFPFLAIALVCVLEGILALVV